MIENKKMINHKHKFIFIHIPKTGGTSIEYVFNKRSVKFKHRTLRKYEELYQQIDQYYKFSFVRNPWDITVSMFNFLWKQKSPWAKQWRKDHDISKLSFKEWVTHSSFQAPTLRCMDINKTNKGHDGDFSSWLTSEKYTVDFIGRFENLQEDFNTICDKIGIPRQKLPKINKTKHKHYTEYYDEETKQIVAEKYAKDIERFGYKFEG